jgi:pimeloyl-ACP methyl ester carboxylesterase
LATASTTLRSPYLEPEKGQAESVLADVALSIDPDSIEFEASAKIATPETALLARFEPGSIKVERFAGEKVDVAAIASTATWQQILEGEHNGLEAVTANQMAVRGNLHRAMELGSLIEPARPYRWSYRVGRVQAGKVGIARIKSFIERHDPAADAASAEKYRTAAPVIFIHGLSATKSSMLPPFTHMARHVEAHAVDLPGHGESDKPMVSYTPAFLATEILHYMDAENIDKAVLVGNSLGGRVSLEIAARWPDRVEKLVLYAPAMAPIKDRALLPLLRLVPSYVGMIPAVFNRRAAELVVSTFLGKSQRTSPALLEAAIDDFLRIYSSPGARRALYSALRAYLLAPPFGEDGFWNSLEKITAPALFIWGRFDPLISWKYSRMTAKTVEHAVSVIYEDGGHVPQIEHPQRTNQITESFILEGKIPESSAQVTVWRT